MSRLLSDRNCDTKHCSQPQVELLSSRGPGNDNDHVSQVVWALDCDEAEVPDPSRCLIANILPIMIGLWFSTASIRLSPASYTNKQ